MEYVSDWKRKGSGDSRGLQNRRSLSLMAMVGSTPTRFRQFSSRLACPPCRFSRPSQYRRSEGTFVLAKRRFLSYVMTHSPTTPPSSNQISHPCNQPSKHLATHI